MPNGFAAVIVAAGRSTRFGENKKEYQPLDGRPVLAHSLSLFLDMPDCMALALVLPPGGLPDAELALGQSIKSSFGGRVIPCDGGDSRAESVGNGLSALIGVRPQWVLIHDAARPHASPALVERILSRLIFENTVQTASRRPCGVIPGLPLTDTIKEATPGGEVIGHPMRENFFSVQTPQAFPYEELQSLENLRSPDQSDDSVLWALGGHRLVLEKGERGNTKITYPEDIQ